MGRDSYLLELARDKDGCVWLKFIDHMGDNTRHFKLEPDLTVTEDGQPVNLSYELQWLYEALHAEDSASD